MGFQTIKLEVGKYYTVSGCAGLAYEFKKSTPKGYNFFNFITDKKLLKRHVYTYPYYGEGCFVFPRGVVIKQVKNPWTDPDMVELYHKYRGIGNITPDIIESIGIDVDANGNII